MNDTVSNLTIHSLALFAVLLVELIVYIPSAAPPDNPIIEIV